MVSEQSINVTISSIVKNNVTNKKVGVRRREVEESEMVSVFSNFLRNSIDPMQSSHIILKRY